MSGAWEQINYVIGQVRNLDLTPLHAIDRIEDILVEAAVKEAPLYPRPDMPNRIWLALAGCALVIGLITGWSARLVTTKDRYINSLAEQHEAAARYYNERTDQVITANQPKPKGVKP